MLCLCDSKPRHYTKSISFLAAVIRTRIILATFFLVLCITVRSHCCEKRQPLYICPGVLTFSFRRIGPPMYDACTMHCMICARPFSVPSVASVPLLLRMIFVPSEWQTHLPYACPFCRWDVTRKMRYVQYIAMSPPPLVHMEHAR